MEEACSQGTSDSFAPQIPDNVVLCYRASPDNSGNARPLHRWGSVRPADGSAPFGWVSVRPLRSIEMRARAHNLVSSLLSLCSIVLS